MIDMMDVANEQIKCWGGGGGGARGGFMVIYKILVSGKNKKQVRNKTKD